ncbi:hypothetical protein L0668_07660 [Paraglaciecola aquimarina]|uniref:Uncharacterized protein n=1 Tax=Paraglaciecola algarum TaxID=3050085 RepID=A0ABS9D7H9_9ALTE|nr:hypothetical protein [Paraglaciecola sp. G1-23]MCF2947978.1 hypothetical protein [Paraglaciecola sp. G1-23]
MELIEAFIAFSNDKFRPILLLIASVFTIYFAYKKIGNKVTAKYTVGTSSFESERITEVVLSNKRDKPVAIHSIHAVFENDLWLQLDKYSPPEILKPFESIALSTKPYSFLSVGGDKFEPNYLDATIYLLSDEKTIKCDSSITKNILDKYTKISVNTCQYNGFVYDETVAFILVYIINDELKTAFIHSSGYIGNEWGFNPNHLGQEATKNNLFGMLHHYNFNKVFTAFTLYKVISLGKVEAVSDET